MTGAATDVSEGPGPKRREHPTDVARVEPRPHGSLRRRLLLLFLLLALTPIVISNAIGYLRSEAIIEQLVQRYLDGIADLEALHVSGQLDRHTRYLQEIAADSVLASLSTPSPAGDGSPSEAAAAQAMLEERLGTLRSFEALYVFREDGEILASAPLSPEDLAFWMEPPPGIEDEPVRIVRDAQPPHAPHLRLAVPVGGPSAGTYLGGTIEVVGTPEFLQLPEHTAGSVESFVVDQAGVPLFISHPHGHLDYSLPLNTPLLEPGAGPTAVYPDRQGIEVVGTIAPVPGRSWLLITEVPVADALQELRALRRLSLWIAALLAVIVGGTAWWTAGRVVAPVRRLVQATRRLGGGDLETRVDVRTRDEVGELGEAFNDMARALADASARVAELHARELERAGQLASVGELASGLAHEIKNPLAGISGGMDLVVKHTEGNTRLEPITEEMRRQVDRIQEAVRDLLAFARPGDPVYMEVGLNEIVERALTLVRPAAAQAGVAIHTELAGDLPPVRVDPEMIRGGLVNLIVNGVQATEAGGRVDVSTDELDGFVRVRVADDGLGISEERLAQIFKPFYTTKHRGTGLGLSITRDMVERHGGSIRVESQEGVGTTFEVRLPARSASRSDPAPEDVG